MKRLIAVLLVASLATPVHAGLVGNASTADRERIAAHLDREDVAAELARHGVSVPQARQRVAALSDAEAAGLAGRIDAEPAGGNAGLGLFVVVTAPIWLPIAAIGLLVVGVAAIASSVNSRNAQPAAAERAPAARPTVYSVAPPFPASCRFNCQ